MKDYLQLMIIYKKGNLLFFRHFFLFQFVNLIIRGDNIKKNIGVIMMAILLAIIFSKVMFTTYEGEQVMISQGNIYLLQYGSFINKDVMEENIKKITDYYLLNEDNKYYIYLGAYTNIETAKKMQKYFEQKNIYTYIKNDYLTDTRIIQEIKEIDNHILNEKDIDKNIIDNKKIIEILKNSVS